MQMRIHGALIAASLACLFAAGCAVPTEGGDPSSDSSKGEAVGETKEAWLGQPPTIVATPGGAVRIDGYGFTPSSNVTVWGKLPGSSGWSVQGNVQTTAPYFPPTCNPRIGCTAFVGGTFTLNSVICTRPGGTASYMAYDVASGTWSALVTVGVPGCRF